MFATDPPRPDSKKKFSSKFALRSFWLFENFWANLRYARFDYLKIFEQTERSKHNVTIEIFFIGFSPCLQDSFA